MSQRPCSQFLAPSAAHSHSHPCPALPVPSVPRPSPSPCTRLPRSRAPWPSRPSPAPAPNFCISFHFTEQKGTHLEKRPAGFPVSQRMIAFTTHSHLRLMTTQQVGSHQVVIHSVGCGGRPGRTTTTTTTTRHTGELNACQQDNVSIQPAWPRRRGCLDLEIPSTLHPLPSLVEDHDLGSHQYGVVLELVTAKSGTQHNKCKCTCMLLREVRVAARHRYQTWAPPTAVDHGLQIYRGGQPMTFHILPSRDGDAVESENPATATSLFPDI